MKLPKRCIKLSGWSCVLNAPTHPPPAILKPDAWVVNIISISRNPDTKTIPSPVTVKTKSKHNKAER